MTEINQTEQKSQAKSLFGTLKGVAQKGKTAWKITKTGVKTAAAAAVLGTGAYVYNQFHKTPEEAHEDTIKMEKKVKNEVEDIAQSWGMTNDASVVQKATKTGLKGLAGKCASWGGALRERLNNNPRE